MTVRVFFIFWITAIAHQRKSTSSVSSGGECIHCMHKPYLSHDVRLENQRNNKVRSRVTSICGLMYKLRFGQRRSTAVFLKSMRQLAADKIPTAMGRWKTM